MNLSGVAPSTGCAIVSMAPSGRRTMEPKDSTTSTGPDRIGTCYYDADAGVYVMPPDFPGEQELRWSKETQVSDEPDKTPATEPRTPLSEQIAQYGEYCEDVLDRLRNYLGNKKFRDEVIKLGAKRLVEGYKLYGDRMYGWDMDKRDEEMMQEVADYTVYGTSGASLYRETD